MDRTTFFVSILFRAKTLRSKDAKGRVLSLSKDLFVSLQQFNLSKNKWQIRQGAKSLLAIGSLIADEYREFERRLDGNFKLVWSEKQNGDIVGVRSQD